VAQIEPMIVIYQVWVLLFDFIYLFEKKRPLFFQNIESGRPRRRHKCFAQSKLVFFRTMVVVSHIHCAIERWDKVRINFCGSV